MLVRDHTGEQIKPMAIVAKTRRTTPSSDSGAVPGSIAAGGSTVCTVPLSGKRFCKQMVLPSPSSSHNIPTKEVKIRGRQTCARAQAGEGWRARGSSDGVSEQQRHHVDGMETKHTRCAPFLTPATFAENEINGRRTTCVAARLQTTQLARPPEPTTAVGRPEQR